MKSPLCLAVATIVPHLLLSAASAHAEPSAGNLIRAEIDGLRNAKGVVRCLLFQSEDGFPSDGAKASQRVVANSNNARGSMGPPAFDKAAFQHLAGAQVLHLSVAY